MIEQITPAERHVLTLLAQGMTNQEIAEQRGTSYWTVKTQVSSLLAKAGKDRRYQLAVAYVRGEL